MNLPTNITIELCKADPTKGHKGWPTRVTWTDPTTGKKKTLDYNVSMDLESTLEHIAHQIEEDIYEE